MVRAYEQRSQSLTTGCLDKKNTRKALDHVGGFAFSDGHPLLRPAQAQRKAPTYAGAFAGGIILLFRRTPVQAKQTFDVRRLLSHPP